MLPRWWRPTWRMDSKKNKHKKKNKTRTNEDKRSLSRMCTRGGTPPATGILRSSLIGRDSWRRYSFVSFFFFALSIRRLVRLFGLRPIPFRRGPPGRGCAWPGSAPPTPASRRLGRRAPPPPTTTTPSTPTGPPVRARWHRLRWDPTAPAPPPDACHAQKNNLRAYSEGYIEGNVKILKS